MNYTKKLSFSFVSAVSSIITNLVQLHLYSGCIGYLGFSKLIIFFIAMCLPLLRADTWETFHGDHALTGFSNDIIPENPKLLWRFQADSKIVATPIASVSRIFFVTDKGTAYALTLAGEKQWSQSLAAKNPSNTTSVIAPLSLMEESIVGVTLRGDVVRLEANTGSIIWNHNTEGPISTAATWFRPEGEPGRVIVINQFSGRLRALDLDNANIIWETAGAGRTDGSLTLSNGKLIFGSCAAAIHILSPIDGTVESLIPLGEGAEIAGGVSAKGNQVFTGNRSGAIVSLDISKKIKIWTNSKWEGELFTTPAIHKKHVVAVNGEGNVVCVNADSGNEQWLYESNSVDTHSPVIAGNKVVLALDGTLYLLILSSGEKIWSFDISDEITSPAIVQKMIIVGTDEGQIVCFGE